MRHGAVLAAVCSLVLASVATGCAPPCRQVCRKVLGCGIDSERVALDECETSCVSQERLYEIWDDQHMQDLFEDHKRCLSSSSCDEIAAGECYEGYEELFVFDPDKEIDAITPPVSSPQ
ncbi:MAG: hypothetical protein ABMB14_02550 [Myxococcota bacterium]